MSHRSAIVIALTGPSAGTLTASAVLVDEPVATGFPVPSRPGARVPGRSCAEDEVVLGDETWLD